MNLVNLYATPSLWIVPFELLKERKPHESISHKTMPTWEQHLRFVESAPYRAWFVLVQDQERVGCAYVSRANEIGIGIFERHRRKGHATKALERLLALYGDERLLANINPSNAASVALFGKLGFTGPIQITLERPAS